MTPKTMKKTPPAFAAYTGITGKPTTLSLVRPGPGNWVCFCRATRTIWAVNNPISTAGSSKMCAL